MAYLVLGADHAAFDLKQWLKPLLEQAGHTVNDVGCHSADSVDYPLIAQSVALALKHQPQAKGILLCGSGVGVMIAANRFPWIRAAHAHEVHLARMSRLHNDSNVLCLGARFVAPAFAQTIIEAWLSTEFEGERHQRRVSQLETLCSL